jgi:hypothetical protein
VEDRLPTPAEARVAQRANRRRGPAAAIVIIVLGWSFMAWVWLTRPPFLFGPDAPPPASAEVTEASLRFAMYLEHQRLEAFAASRGRFPAALAQAGAVEDDVSYERTSTGFVLLGARDGVSLRLTSAMDVDSFLGRSLDVLGR